MALLRLYVPKVTAEQKSFMAEKIFEAANPILHGPPEEWITLHFIQYNAEDYAVNGRLMSEMMNPDVLLEVRDHDLSEQKKETLVQELTPLLLKLFGLGPQMAYKISILFADYEARDFAVGGRFADQMESGGPGETPPRGGLRRDQRGSVPPFGA